MSEANRLKEAQKLYNSTIHLDVYVSTSIWNWLTWYRIYSNISGIIKIDIFGIESPNIYKVYVKQMTPFILVRSC